MAKEILSREEMIQAYCKHIQEQYENYKKAFYGTYEILIKNNSMYENYQKVKEILDKVSGLLEEAKSIVEEL